MDKTAIQSSVPTPDSTNKPLEATQPARKPVRARNPILLFVHFLASLRLTVALLVLAMVLVLVGTLAQRFWGIQTVVNTYFYAWVVKVPFQVWVPSRWQVPGWFPFPGGWLIGGALLINLLAAHLIRFKVSWRRTGILMIHSGLILLMLGELVRGVWAVEGNMIIVEGGSSNYVQDSHHPELAVIKPLDEKTDEVVAIPGWQLKKPGLVRHELLPFNVEVLRYMNNSAKPVPAEADAEVVANKGDGKFEVAEPRPEVSGTDPEQKVDFPSAYIRLTDKESGEELGTYLVSLWYYVEDRPQTVTVGDTTYELFLRFQREYKPYALHLIDFNHELYPGTQVPKDYSSVVRVTDPEYNEDREVRIWMNHPLRYRGETFYQSSFLEGDAGTVLQVVRNPGWLMPYIACALVSIGMLVHFGITLVNFLKRRAAL